MGDLNFFEGYVEKKVSKINASVIYFIGLGLFVLFLVGYIGYNAMIINGEKEVVHTLKQEAEDPSTISKVGVIREKQDQLASLKGSIDQIKRLETDIAQTKKIDDIFLAEINANIPNNIFLTSINIEKDWISIVGISKDKWAIPEFQKNLESLDGYDEVFVPYITLEDNQYNFAMDIEKRGVVEDEGTNQE